MSNCRKDDMVKRDKTTIIGPGGHSPTAIEIKISARYFFT
jgi:hypothetical protein